MAPLQPVANRSQSRPQAPNKKLVIKPLKSKPKLPADFETKTWTRLQEAIQAVHAQSPVACSLEELYRAVEDMCLHKMADRLYAGLQQACDQHTSRQIEKLASSQAADDVIFLRQMHQCWDNHTSQMLTIRSIFLYLDRSYVLSASSVRSLYEMGLQQFRIHLVQHAEVLQKAIAGIKRLIEAERQGEAVDRQLLAHLLRMTSALGIYEDSFQTVFLASTELFYRAESQRMIQEVEVAAYLQHCERRIQEEYERCQHYLESSTRRHLIKVVEEQLLEVHMQTLLDRGFDGLMAEQRIPDLARFYSLAGRVQALPILKQRFKDYIRISGLALIMDEEKDKDMVQLLLEFKSSLDTTLQHAFQKNETFGNALKEAFENFINQRQNKPAELIAKYMDAQLKGGSKSQTDEELEADLDRALMLFRYISGKDVFEAFYKKDLAKRLLLNRSASVDAEKNMITKLKHECGAQFTNKLEGMFKDIELSRDIMISLKQSPTATSKFPHGIDMSVNILTSGFWPSYPILEANLPVELNEYQAVFRDFYLSKHSGRRLVWHNSLGSCNMRAQFKKGAKELQLSLFQTIILMLFNDADDLSFSDIKAATGIEEKELRRTLQSLACGKFRPINKTPKGRDVQDDDAFSFNTDFQAALFRVKINSVQLKETVEENLKTNEQVLQDRQYQIDAAIVRTMKTRKTLSHKLLVNELVVQLKFPIKTTDLKKRIESLIDREYLERDRDNAQVYNYLA